MRLRMALGGLTLQMSHDPAWRDSCASTRHDKQGRWLSAANLVLVFLHIRSRLLSDIDSGLRVEPEDA